MSECCDVLVAHGPFATAGRHGSQSELVFYQNLRLVVGHKPQSPITTRRNNNGGSRAQQSPSPTAGQCDDKLECQPRRPCLVVRVDSDGSMGSSSSSSSDENELSSPTRSKKKVVFADDRGLSLTQVRLMNEPSNQPPKLMTVSPYLNQPASTGPSAAAAKSDNRWRLRFSQPASSYVDFRRRLDTGNVSLENVIVRNPDRRIIGTVKVRNVSYDKLVFVRCTDDGWTTYRDTACTYVRNNARDGGPAPVGGGGGGGCPAPGVGGVTAIYDTFSFRLPLPDRSPTMEFAVCYRGDGFECWDNNSNDNYCLSVDSPSPSTQQTVQPAAAAAVASASADLLPLTPSAAASVDDSDRPQTLPPVHYFGAQSRQNLMSEWSYQNTDSSAYW